MELTFGIVCSLLVAVCSADMIRTNADETGGMLVLAGTADLVLNCSTTSEVASSDAVKWFKSMAGADRVEVAADKRVLLEGGLLTIKRPTEMDAGNYTCSFTTVAVTSNKVEETIQVVTNVTVRMPSKSINKQEGEELSIMCRAYGKPIPAITWTRDGQDIFVSVKNATLRVNLHENEDGVPQAQLTLSNLLRPDDAGDYCCRAENIANAAQKCIIIRVKDKYAALWPFIGIVAEVVILTAIIYVYEKKKSKPDMDDSDTDHANDRPEPKGDVRQRK